MLQFDVDHVGNNPTDGPAVVRIDLLFGGQLVHTWWLAGADADGYFGFNDLLRRTKFCERYAARKLAGLLAELLGEQD